MTVSDLKEWKDEAEKRLIREGESSLTYYADLCRRIIALIEHVEQIQILVDQQAEDEGLWFEPKYVSEAYLQSHLRKLHEVIEGKTSAEVAIGLLYD